MKLQGNNLPPKPSAPPGSHTQVLTKPPASQHALPISTPTLSFCSPRWALFGDLEATLSKDSCVVGPALSFLPFLTVVQSLSLS